MVPDPGHYGHPPKVCSQKSVTIRARDYGKLKQPHLWGSPEWEAMYNRRTYVEGFFGIWKNETVGGRHRGSHQFTRLAREVLITSLQFAHANVHLLRKWHEETGHGDPEHPLLRPEPANHGFSNHDADSALEALAELLGTDPDRLVIEDNEA